MLNETNNIFVVLPVGRNGGLLLLWKNDVHIDVLSFFLCHVDIVLRLNEEPLQKNSHKQTEKNRRCSVGSWLLLIKNNHRAFLIDNKNYKRASVGNTYFERRSRQRYFVS